MTSESNIDRKIRESQEQLNQWKQFTEEFYLFCIARGIQGDITAQTVLPQLGIHFETVNRTAARLHAQQYIEFVPGNFQAFQLTEKGIERLINQPADLQAKIEQLLGGLVE